MIVNFYMCVKGRDKNNLEFSWFGLTHPTTIVIAKNLKKIKILCNFKTFFNPSLNLIYFYLIKFIDSMQLSISKLGELQLKGLKRSTCLPLCDVVRKMCSVSGKRPFYFITLQKKVKVSCNLRLELWDIENRVSYGIF